MATSRSRSSARVDVLAVGDADVQHRARPALRPVADAQHLAVADVPDGAVDVADPGHAQADGLDDARGVAEVDHVADAVLVLDEHEETGDDVADQRLRAETDGDRRRCRRWRAAGRWRSPAASRIIRAATAPMVAVVRLLSTDASGAGPLLAAGESGSQRRGEPILEPAEAGPARQMPSATWSMTRCVTKHRAGR